MPELTIPNFFVVGAGKAGTTSLHAYLNQHPDIFMSAIKEPSFFADEVRPYLLDPAFRKYAGTRLIGTWEDYIQLFHPAKAVGDATPSYLWSETAARNIHKRIPNAKIVMILRDPTERAFSHYLHQLSEGLVRTSFRQHLERCAKGGHSNIGVYYPFLEVGLYCEQVKRYLALFPRENIRIYWYEQDWAEPQHLMRDLFDFLSVDNSFTPDVTHRSHARRAPRLGAAHGPVRQLAKLLVPDHVRQKVKHAAFESAPAMSRADREYLIAYYRDDIRKLEALLDRDLTAWLR